MGETKKYVTSYMLLKEIQKVANGPCACATDAEMKAGASPEYCTPCQAIKILSAFHEDAERFLAGLSK